MYCAYQDRRDLEDDLYQEDEGDSDGSEAKSELEFHLYSQLHYSSNAGVLEEQDDRGEAVKGRDSQQPEGPEKAVNADGEREHTGESRSPSPDLSKLLHLLRKKKKKEEEEKKREKLKKQKTGKPKGPRSFSSFIEEVIVIDSSPDVISISEDDTADGDDDEGVCTLKGRHLLRLQTSTPAQKKSQKQSLSELVTVDSSTSESDSSESDSSESSDSDDVENWMILGRGKQDGDQSISLNLKGASDSNEDAEEEEGGSGWFVSTKDKVSHICNRDKGPRAMPLRLSNRYYTNKNVKCRNCNKDGHISYNCHEPKKLTPCYLCGDPSHMVFRCPKKHCNNCGLPGHLYDSCSERAHWKRRCERCGMTGHLDDACPEIWRQYHITTKAGAPTRHRREDQGRTQQVYCYNCSKRHFGHVCKLRGMFNGTYRSAPFINYYDMKEDIEKRENWIVFKVNELKKKGIFLTTRFQTAPRTPGPPNKKQKVNHHNNHQHHHGQPNHTPRQSPNNQRFNHTFFNDSDFVEAAAAAPKAKKNNKHKQQESHVKPWKPKRPVPASKDRPPAAKLIVDEAKDFPRGGGKGEDAEKKRKGKKASKRKQAPSAPPEAATSPQGSASKMSRRKENKKNWVRRNADKKPATQMYPADENLFIIKQRKGKKK